MRFTGDNKGPQAEFESASPDPQSSRITRLPHCGHFVEIVLGIMLVKNMGESMVINWIIFFKHRSIK